MSLNEDLLKNRKKEHLEYAEAGQIKRSELDTRFNYSPLLGKLVTKEDLETTIFGKRLKLPLWISSITGGRGDLIKTINGRLAKVAKEYGIGFALGSIRPLLDHIDDSDLLTSYDFRKIIGDEVPFYANLGVTQLEQLLLHKEIDKLKDLISMLRVDGVIIHVNPIQEFFQKEGDFLKHQALWSIEKLLGLIDCKVIVKEVGQGMDYDSLLALMKLPLAGVEFGAFGGTNFTQIELLRSNKNREYLDCSLAMVGHDPFEMVNSCNLIINRYGKQILCKEFIISGGVRKITDAYYLKGIMEANSVVGVAYPFLEKATISYQALSEYVDDWSNNFLFCKNFLSLKS